MYSVTDGGLPLAMSKSPENVLHARVLMEKCHPLPIIPGSGQDQCATHEGEQVDVTVTLLSLCEAGHDLQH